MHTASPRGWHAVARGRRYAGVAAAVLGLTWSSGAWAQACDTGVDADCDGDSFSPAEGDCDDTDVKVGPNAKETCANQVDDDCDGFVDNGCERDVFNGSIGGGGGCTSEGAIGNAAVVLFLPLLGLGGRRRRSA